MLNILEANVGDDVDTTPYINQSHKNIQVTISFNVIWVNQNLNLSGGCKTSISSSSEIKNAYVFAESIKDCCLSIVPTLGVHSKCHISVTTTILKFEKHLHLLLFLLFIFFVLLFLFLGTLYRVKFYKELTFW